MAMMNLELVIILERIDFILILRLPASFDFWNRYWLTIPAIMARMTRVNCRPTPCSSGGEKYCGVVPVFWAAL